MLNISFIVRPLDATRLAATRPYRPPASPATPDRQRLKPLMGRDQTFLCPAIFSVRQTGRPRGHEFQHVQQLPGDLDVSLVACVMKGDEDLIGQAPGVTRLWVGGVGRRGGHCPLRVRMTFSLALTRRKTLHQE